MSFHKRIQTLTNLDMIIFVNQPPSLILTEVAPPFRAQAPLRTLHTNLLLQMIIIHLGIKMRHTQAPPLTPNKIMITNTIIEFMTIIPYNGGIRLTFCTSSMITFVAFGRATYISPSIIFFKIVETIAVLSGEIEGLV